jgi:hypothetical protein
VPKSGYRLERERYAPLDLALRSRRWDLFDLLLEWGGDLKSVDVYTVLDTYNVELYEPFRAAGYDLTERHEMASILGHGTRTRPLEAVQDFGSEAGEGLPRAEHPCPNAGLLGTPAEWYGGDEAAVAKAQVRDVRLEQLVKSDNPLNQAYLPG